MVKIQKISEIGGKALFPGQSPVSGAKPCFRGRFFQLMIFDGEGWFRLFGKGLCWKDTTRYRLLFSERNGYAKHVMVGRWSIAWLS
jgi:hypothetical protein